MTKILGGAICKPDLQWITISDEQLLNNLLSAEYPKAAKGYVDMNIGRRNNLYDDYIKHKSTFGKIKVPDFAEEFAAVYNKQ